MGDLRPKGHCRSTGVGKNLIDVTLLLRSPPEYGPNAEAKTSIAALAALVKITRVEWLVLRFPTNEHWKASPQTADALAIRTSRWGVDGQKAGRSGAAYRSRPLPSSNDCAVEAGTKRQALCDRSWELPGIPKWQPRWQRCHDAWISRTIANV